MRQAERRDDRRETVPGDSLIAKVLQQASSRTLPKVLMLDNPDLQQIAASGALAPVGDFGLSADGYAEGIVSASAFEGQVYGLQPVTNTIGLFYNETMLAEAGVAPPTTWDELKAAAAKLTAGERYGIAFSAVTTYEGTWQFLPFMSSNGGDETNIASPEVAEALQLWVDLVSSGSASTSTVYIGTYMNDWSSVMATAVLAPLPAVVLLIVAQRYVAAGVTGGSLK